MQRKFRNRTQLRNRLGLRTVMNAVVLFSLVFIFSSVFIVQLLKDETGNAASNPMVIANIEVSQDTIPVYRGSNRQLMLKINVITKGNSNKLNFNAITLAARGSSPGAIDLIRNARLWYTGNESHFSPMKQIGSTLETISKNNFIISAQKTLQEGSNYFWLTYDFSNSQIHGQHFADAECIAVRIGTLDYNPPVAAPPGKRKVLQNKPYFSTGNGDISSLTSWNTNRDGSGDTPHNFNELSATFSVQPGHIMKNTLSACLPVLIIENGGVLSSTSDIITNQMDVFNGGTYIQNKIITSHTNIKQLNIQNNGNYIHNNKGSIPGNKRYIAKNSNIIITSCSENTFRENIAWGNLIIDYKDSLDVNFGFSFSTINGDLEIRKTGTNSKLYTDNNYTINILGDLIVNGGNIAFCANNNTVNLNIKHNLSIKNGKFTDSFNGKLCNGGLIINVGKSISFLGGASNFTSKNSIIQINNYVAWIQNHKAQVTLPHIQIDSGATLSLLADTLLFLPASRNFMVKTGGLFECNMGILIGDGTFELMPGSTISTAHQFGINSYENTGSIQTLNRVYNEGMNVAYNGSVSPQYSGVFNTGNQSTVVNNFVLQKSNFTGIVVLKQDITVTGTFYHQRGNLNKNSYSFSKERHIGQAMLNGQ